MTAQLLSGRGECFELRSDRGVRQLAPALGRRWGQRIGGPEPVQQHCVISGGGLSPEATQWVACRPGFYVVEDVVHAGEFVEWAVEPVRLTRSTSRRPHHPEGRGQTSASTASNWARNLRLFVLRSGIPWQMPTSRRFWRRIGCINASIPGGSMQSMSLPSRLWGALAVAFACAQGVAGDHAAASQQAPAPEITREDILVPHVLTVPANAGQRVGIFVRHVRRAAPGPTNGPVLFTNGGSISTLAVLDLDYKTYSIAAALARDGFDVYLMDHTGYGRSPRPMMDNPCNVDPSQQQWLIPKPLAAPCNPSYAHHLVTIFTELPEIDSIVDYIRKQTGRNKIFLAGWSRATNRFGLYAGQHPDKVERLAIVGPGYRRDAPSDFPASNARTTDQSVRTTVPPWPIYVRKLDDPESAP
jgi:pimeloyl-ACP methyl ester carboxylesterase